MRRGLPIYGKVLCWLLINVLVLVLLVVGFLRLQFHLSLDWMLVGPAGDRISMIGDQLTDDLAALPEKDWMPVLRRYEATHGVAFALFDRNGLQVMGAPLAVPSDLAPKLTDRRPIGERPPVHRAPAKRVPPALADGAKNRPSDAPPKPRFMQRTGDPARYWAGIHVDLVYGPEYRPLTLVMVSDTITGGGLFIDLWPWLGLAAACLGLSALVWMPFVRGLTRSIHRLNNAARTIAQGQFEQRVPETRQDELGELSTSVNTMAQQLGDYVAAQRRITADVAHELCSPIARMQMALGVVEQRAAPDQANYLKKLDNELQHMARLVGEVLTFSKAETLPDREAPSVIELRALVDDAVAREAAGIEVAIDVPASLKVIAIPEALDRALGNVLRNAVRYAAHAGPVEIHASLVDGSVVISIADVGPGVPSETLSRLFEPFYRPEVARARHTGGSGLGLAIVQRCIEACGGTVTARLRHPQGLEVEMRIPQRGGNVEHRTSNIEHRTPMTNDQ